MKNMLVLSILFCAIAMPAPAQLTAEDLEKIRQIVKDSETELKLEIEKVDSNLRLKIEETDSNLRLKIEETDSNLKSEIQQVDSNLKSEIEKVDSNLRSEIEKTHAKLDAIDARLRIVETGVAELRGRNIGFLVVKDWMVAICAVVAIFISIIALRKTRSADTPTPQDTQKALS